jgi:hypothetical protein
MTHPFHNHINVPLLVKRGILQGKKNPSEHAHICSAGENNKHKRSSRREYA